VDRPSESPLTVLVTGGCGFIGVNLARRLRARGHRPVAFDDLSTGHEEDGRAAGFEDVLVGDIRDGDAVARAALGADAVVHLAAKTGVVDSVEDPRSDLDVNVAGTLNVLLAARDANVGSFVFASSGAPLGDAPPPGREDVAPRPRSPYGASKLAGEGLCSAFAGSYGLPTVALRFTNVYGPWSYHKGSVVATFLRNAMVGRPLVVYGDGEQTRDFLFVDDLCDAVIAAVENPPDSPVLQLGTGVETTVNQLVDAILELFPERGVEVRREPARAGEVARSYSDVSRARAELGYDPRTELRTGLAVTRDWFVEAYGA
jgi:UDP-glucose 4-epimerase